MLVFANAKINLGLNVVERRPDGYHNLETLFYPIPLRDALEMLPLDDDRCGDVVLHSYGDVVACADNDNLVVRAYRLLKADFSLPPMAIHLYKAIPSGAGLGGGSADAAFALRLLNRMCCLGLDNAQLEAYAQRLGADCPFFIENTPAYAEGTGNLLTPVALRLQGYQLAVVKPDIFVSTREAFARITPKRPAVNLCNIVAQPIDTWRDALCNDFEESVFAIHPEIAAVKASLYAAGARYAAMSGSGSALFGIFEPTQEVRLTPPEGVRIAFSALLKLP